MTPPNNPNGWDKWGSHVIAEVARQGNLLGVISQQLADLRVDIAKMKTEIRIKSGIMLVVGAVAGSAAMMVIQVFTGSKG